MIIIGTEKEIEAMIEEACPYCISILKCDGMRGVLVREPYKIGGDKKTTLCLIWYGTNMSSSDIHRVKPTGRHFDEVDQLLQALKEVKAE